MTKTRFFIPIPGSDSPLARFVRGKVAGTSAGLLEVELRGDHLELALRPVAEHARVDLGADQVGDHQPLDVIDALDRRAVEIDDQVFRTQPRSRRRTSLDD